MYLVCLSPCVKSFSGSFSHTHAHTHTHTHTHTRTHAQITTSAGTWVKLTAQSLEDLNCTSTTEGYALAYNKDKDQCYLEEMEVSDLQVLTSELYRISCLASGSS